ncbi:MAG: hypothetical protein ABL886_11705 [Rhodoglobus sp.]
MLRFSLVPYAGTAADGRHFFLSEELFYNGHFGEKDAKQYVGVFLWTADGEFDEVRVDVVDRVEGVPPAQAVPAGADELVAARLAELGDYELEPIVVAPFSTEVDGVVFGFVAREFDGMWTVNVEPGNFIAYYEPWDGIEYDT